MSRPALHLGVAAEAVRAFCHDSYDTSDGWQYPGDTYAALGNLSHLASMLAQAVDHATFPAVRTHEAGDLRIDNGGDPDAQLAELLAARRDAEAAAGRLAHALSRMHNASSPMGSSAP
jgi:hypothetical protein